MSTTIVENRFVGELLTELAEARSDLVEKQEEKNQTVSLADERKFSAEFVLQRLVALNRERIEAGTPALTQQQQNQIIEQVIDTSFNGAVLWRFWQDNPDAENVWVKGDQPCRIQTKGEMTGGPPLASSNDELRQAIKFGLRQSRRPNSPWDHLNHQLEYVMPDGTRVTAIDFVTDPPAVTLRRPTLSRVVLDDLVANNTLSQSCADFLDAAVKSKLRILIGGSMNTGKTVLLRALAAALKPSTITVVVEAQGELMISSAAGDIYPIFVQDLEARKPGADGQGEVSLNQLIEDAQRQSPGCVIVGEVRGEEAKALAMAVGQGYQVMSTIHGTSAVQSVLNAGLYLEQFTQIQTEPARARIAEGIDLAVFMEMVGPHRMVAEVAAIGSAVDGIVKSDLVFDHTGVMGPLPEHLKRVFSRNGYHF